MGIVIAISFAALLGGFALWVRSANAKRARPYREAAARLGLSFTSGMMGAWPKVFGVVRKIGMRAGHAVERRRAAFVVTGRHGQVAKAFALRDGRYSRQGGSETVRTGDASMDERYWLSGPEDLVAALATAQLREHVAALRHAWLRVEAGEVRATVFGQPTAADPLLGTIDAVAGLTLQLCEFEPGWIVERLVRNASSDPLPEVRIRNLEALGRHHAGDPRAATALERARRDPDAAVADFATRAHRPDEAPGTGS